MNNNLEQDVRYLGEFQVAGLQLHGEIQHNKKTGLILLDVVNKVKGHGKAYGRLKYITGQLDTGCSVTLCNCLCVNNNTVVASHQELCFQVEYIIVGTIAPEQCGFRCYTCEIENGLAWSGLSQLDTTDFEQISVKRIEAGLSYSWFGAKISFSTALRTNIWSFHRSESCHVTEHLEITIETDRAEDTHFFLGIRDKILALISFAIKDNVNIVEQFLTNYNDMITYPDGTQEPSIYTVITNEPYRYLGRTHRVNYNFLLEQLPKDLDCAKTLEKLVPIFNLYQSLFKYRDMPAEMVFLNIIQAIETFHARFFYDNKKKKYIQSVQNRFGSYHNYDYLKSLLLNDTQLDENCNYIILVSRINDLLIGKYDGLFFDYYARNGDFAQTIADTRHYYTHYGESKEKKALKGSDLGEAVYILRLLLEYYVCSVLGIDINKKIRRELANHRTYKEIDRFYELNQHELQSTNPS